MKTLFAVLLGFVSSLTPAQTVLLDEQFDSAPPGWTSWHAAGTWDTITQYGLNVYGGTAYSTSLYPTLWGVDRNHGDPGGLGDLGMVVHVCLPGNVNGCVSNAPVMDLRGARLQVRIRYRCCEGSYSSYGVTNTGPNSPSGTRLVWFFQMYDPALGKNVNMAAIGTPLDETWNNGDWMTIEIAPKLNDWACLGAIAGKEYLYGCQPAHVALANANVSMGLIYFPLDRNNIPVGRIEIDWIKVVKG